MNRLEKCKQSHIQNVYNPRSDRYFHVYILYMGLYTPRSEGVRLSMVLRVVLGIVLRMVLGVVPK